MNMTSIDIKRFVFSFCLVLHGIIGKRIPIVKQDKTGSVLSPLRERCWAREVGGE
jgi:hypothetical protein